MPLPEIPDVIDALSCRAELGREAGGALKLAGLQSVAQTQRLSRGMTTVDAIDDVLWRAVGAVKTSYLQGSRGGSHHTQEALRCFLAVFVRLDIRTRLEHDPAFEKSKIFPELSLAGGSKHERATKNYELLFGYDPGAPWRSDGTAGAVSVWAAMCAALSLSPKGAIEKFRRLAPVLLAAHLIRGEIDLSLPHAGAVTPVLRDIEVRLDQRGLLSSYSSTRIVRDGLDEFIDLLEAPLHGFTEPVEDFAFVLKQLDTTYHSLKGVMVYEDTKVNQNDAYFERQLEVLSQRGIRIERVFLYEEANKAEVLALEEMQRTRAQGIIAGCTNEGSYTSYLVSSVLATGMREDESLPSFVIIDYGQSTQRVVTQRFGPLEHYAMSASTTDIRRKAERFDVLMNHADKENHADKTGTRT
jgi:hypothetical protein